MGEEEKISLRDYVDMRFDAMEKAIGSDVASLQSVIQKLDELATRLDRLDGVRKGTLDVRTMIFSMAFLVVGVASVLITLRGGH